MTDKTGIVVIGRNEGARLKTCLESVIGAGPVVYVDSGSTDESVNIALKLGVTVVNLDLSIPFTAARARNEGFQKLCDIAPDIRFVQFVDGDCEVVKTWVDCALLFLKENEDVAVVCGRRRERYPDASVYNMLCDIEWNTPVGEAKACGGDALMRVKAFQQVKGYNPTVIAGEEPELCVRIRKTGWRIWRLDEEMTLHDANMMYFSQWWKRNVRSGYAFALGANMHGRKPEKHWVTEVTRAQIWGAYIPLFILVAAFLEPAALFLIAVYPLQIVKVALKNREIIKHNWLYSFYVTIGKFPEIQGQLKFYWNWLFNKQSKIIEYKV